MEQGSPLTEYILSRRLAHAHSELCDPVYGHLGVAEVSYRWAFASHANFSRAFKEHFGATPSAARAAHRHSSH